MSTPLSFCELCEDELALTEWYGVLLCPGCIEFATRQLARDLCACLECLRLAKRMEERS
jgi:hypothetical protein